MRRMSRWPSSRRENDRPHLPAHRDRRHVARKRRAAISNGLDRAAQTLRNLDWFEVKELRGNLIDGHVDHYQVTMRVGFRLE